MEEQGFFSRRHFLKATAAAAGGLAGLAVLPPGCWPDNAPAADGLHIIGAREGFSPQVGTLVSMLHWMRQVVVNTVQGLKIQSPPAFHKSLPISGGGLTGRWLRETVLACPCAPCWTSAGRQTSFPAQRRCRLRQGMAFGTELFS
jgi:hypothetical protein